MYRILKRLSLEKLHASRKTETSQKDIYGHHFG